MRETDYPCSYLDSNKASLKSQALYKNLIRLSLAIMFISVVLSSIDDKYTTGIYDFEKFNGLVLLLSALITISLIIFRPEKNWYIGRAVAESIKTLSWKYMMQAEPFDKQAEVDKFFVETCSKIVEAAIKEKFTFKVNCYHSDFVTQKMRTARDLPILERKDLYASQRIENQMKWYDAKSKLNNRKAILYGIVIALTQILGFIYLIFLVDVIASIHLNEILVFVATSCIGVIELNRFKELHQAYSFTKFELTTIRNKFNVINNDTDLCKFVDDAEQAISREHTMWLARRSEITYISKFK